MKGWWLWTGMALVAGMLGASLWPAHALRGALFVVSFICVLGAFVNLALDRRRERYDLDELRRVHEQAEVDAIDVAQPAEFDSVHCLCGEVYRSNMPACPRCHRSQY